MYNYKPWAFRGKQAEGSPEKWKEVRLSEDLKKRNDAMGSFFLFSLCFLDQMLETPAIKITNRQKQGAKKCLVSLTQQQELAT